MWVCQLLNQALDQAVQGPNQIGLEHLQEWDIHIVLLSSFFFLFLAHTMKEYFHLFLQVCVKLKLLKAYYQLRKILYLSCKWLPLKKLYTLYSTSPADRLILLTQNHNHICCVLSSEHSWTFHLQNKLQILLTVKAEHSIQKNLCLWVNHNTLFNKTVEYCSQHVVNTT